MHTPCNIVAAICKIIDLYLMVFTLNLRSLILHMAVHTIMMLLVMSVSRAALSLLHS
eukprot:COSAG03_NODE_1857_length_3425_cov_78.546603_1_plen_57_part_00